MNFSQKLLSLAAEAEEKLEPYFKAIDEMSFYHTSRVLEAFSEFRVSDAMFAGTSGYGYDDKGRDTLDAIYARVFDAEAALVRHNIVNGTQALTIGLFGLLRPGDIMLSLTGKPYGIVYQLTPQCLATVRLVNDYILNPPSLASRTHTSV